MFTESINHLIVGKSDSNSILSHFPSEHRAEAKAVSLESPGEDDAEDGCDQLTAGEAKVP